MDFLPAAFDALALVHQFVVYKLIPSKSRPGKTDKIPLDYRTGNAADPHDPKNWTNGGHAIGIAKKWGEGYGIGFVFTKNDPFFFVDIDNCLSACGTKWNDNAERMLAAFPGAAVEVSSSGKGLHIIASGTPPIHRTRDIHDLGMEFYTCARFVALTGWNATGSAALDFTPVLQWLAENYFPIGSTTFEGASWRVEWEFYSKRGADPEWNGSTNDEELLSRMLRSQSTANLFGAKASFADLWEGNVEALEKSYPDPERAYNESSADAGIAQHLAFWTGNDVERMRRFMFKSGLAREKYEREDYLPRTILASVGKQRDFLQDKQPQNNTIPVDSQVSQTMMDVSGATLLNRDQQKTLFAGTVYISDEHRVLIPGGYLLNPERFRAMYGGYSFIMDNENAKVSRNAWEAFIESQILRAPRAITTCFRPDLPAGQILTMDGETRANIYWPVKTRRSPGDVYRFLRHIEKLFPDPTDQIIVISYLAALIQYPGIKFQWCPLIQGVQGNGKTFLTRCIAFAIGDRYSYFPKAEQLESRFNDWLYAKIFVGVEDIYVPDSRHGLMEILKPMITSNRQEIEPKGGAKVIRDIYANFLINTNHKDGLRVSKHDRRFSVFYSAQQEPEDLQRDGMDGNYFSDLYGWAAHQDGFAMIHEFLATYPIPDLYNPGTSCNRAPQTSSTRESYTQGLGVVEHEVMEAIEEQLYGFRGGYVSSVWLNQYLEKIQCARRVPSRKRREFMQSLGYERHPGLPDGRLDNPLPAEGCKAIIYIKRGHPDMNLNGSTAIAAGYTKAQLDGV